MVLIAAILGTICYHWGTSAVWLFGIEGCVWVSATVAGRFCGEALTARGMPLVAPVAAVALAAAVIILRQHRTSAAWGIFMTAVQSDADASASIREQGALTRACSALASDCNLSQREEEVLFLLAQRKTARDIEQELCVANGTARAHINHVYQKLGIHTREELFARVEKAQGRTNAQAPRPRRRY